MPSPPCLSPWLVFSKENVITDLNLFKVIHQPRRFAKLTSMWGARHIIKVWVRVHKGFYTAWMKNDFNKILLDRVGAILGAMPAPSAATVLVTGHSLGGALATLGAHSMRTRFPNTQVAVYTYGSPRVGNCAFALESNDLVTEHFAVINDQDPVARVPKGSYKRVGDRVIVNDMGDIIVRPGFLEMQVINHAGEREGWGVGGSLSLCGFLPLLKQRDLPPPPLPNPDQTTKPPSLPPPPPP